MKDLISYFGVIFSKIYEILDVQFFSDFPITYIELIMGVVVISFIFKFIFGGIKEFNGFENQISGNYYTRINNFAREFQIQQEERKFVKNAVAFIRDRSNDIDERDAIAQVLYDKGYNLDGKKVR